MERFRLFLLLGVFLILFGMLEAQLFRLQVSKKEYYIEKVEALGDRNAELLLRRGEIFITDRNNNKIPVALNKDFPMLYAVPKEIEDPEATMGVLAPLIGWEKEELVKALENSPPFFRLLVERAEEDMLKAVEEKNIKGVKRGVKQARVYPFEDLASHVLGFVGMNEKYDAPLGLDGNAKDKL